MPSERSAAAGYGLGLRRQHFDDILRERPPVDWFEILTENHLVDGGRPLHYLERIRADYPLAMHGVSLSIGSVDALDVDYLQRIRRLAERIEPARISDHLCWTGVDGINTHDLLPLPLTQDALRHVADRVLAVQDFLRRPLLLENVSSYFRFAHSTLDECEFLRELVRRTGCLLLVDVNNIHVGAINHGFDAMAWLRALPPASVAQLHIAGHEDRGTHLIDTHDRPVAAPVWELFAAALRLFGPVAVSIERDAAIPPLPELLDELATARRIGEEALAGRETPRARAVATVIVSGNDGAAPTLQVAQRAVQRGVLTAQPAAAAFVADTAALPRTAQLDIYAQAYRARIVEALAHDFAALRAWLGEHEFAALVHAYIDAHPSRHRSLRDVGGRLDAFLATTAPYDGHAGLYAIARFEWALCNAFDAADTPPATAADLHAVEPARWAGVRLRFHPSLQWLDALGNVPSLWRALRDGRAPPAFVADDASWLVWRQRLALLFRPLDGDERCALLAFRDGAAFACVCDRLRERMPDEAVPARLAGLIQRWLREDLIAAIDAPRASATTSFGN